MTVIEFFSYLLRSDKFFVMPFMLVLCFYLYKKSLQTEKRIKNHSKLTMMVNKLNTLCIRGGIIVAGGTTIFMIVLYIRYIILYQHPYTGGMLINMPTVLNEMYMTIVK